MRGRHGDDWNVDRNLCHSNNRAVTTVRTIVQIRYYTSKSIYPSVIMQKRNGKEMGIMSDLSKPAL